tara:strand:- start:1778 stop:2944 length:1167 start_codon:yes stop_codon:yes gene_type:complete
MSRYHSYLNSAEKILTNYSGKEPFSIHLKAFFKANKKYGSRDRRQVSHLCYCFFRLGKMAQSKSISDRVLIGLFLCSSETNPILDEIKPEWVDSVSFTVKEKLEFLKEESLITDVFPWKGELSKDVEYDQYCASFFEQPNLFIRLRPKHEKNVLSKLGKEQISFERVSDSCISLPNGTRLDDVIQLNKVAVVQDYNSQKVGELLEKGLYKENSKVWDCCAGSGGKSIMAFDLNPKIKLSVSDIRVSILANLKKRFNDAGISGYKEFVVDLSVPNAVQGDGSYDLVMADVPCTGSGTWGRTPEQLYYFEKNKISDYVSLQRKIVTNVVSKIKENGFLLYSTCSAFREENEDNLQFFKEHLGLEVEESSLLKGYDKNADTMFVALLRKIE